MELLAPRRVAVHCFEECFVPAGVEHSIFRTVSNTIKGDIMRPARLLAATFLSGSALLALALPAASAPVMGGASLAEAAPASAVEKVQYYYHGGPRRYYYGHGHYNDGAALGLGLAAGAIVGGAIAAGAAQANQNAAWCAQRYRSYDPRSGTYLNRDGNRYPCP
jgi:hypothetical protein